MPNYRKTNTAFVNPYNFVKKDREELERKAFGLPEAHERFTGVIECTLKTETPIFIPNTTSVNDQTSDVFNMRDNNENIIQSYDFFSYTHIGDRQHPEPAEPVIPGSSIRGVVRSVFETVTNSCYSTTDDEQVLYRRSTIPFYKGGILYEEDGEWYIEEMEVVMINERQLKHNWVEGEELYVTTRPKPNKPFLTEVIDVSEEEKPGYRLGYLHLGERAVNKHYERVFLQKDDPEIISVPSVAVKNLLKNYELYKDDKVNIALRQGNHSGYSNIHGRRKSLKDISDILVYFKAEKGKLVYLSPAAIGREVFTKTLTEIIGEHKACSSIDNLCPACRLFGFVSEEQQGGHEQRALGSRIRITDARYTGNMPGPFANLYHDVVVLKELASPKLSCSEFYLERPRNADLWNYDYALKWRRKKDNNGKSKVTNKYDLDPKYEARIRGRKFYWHHNGQYAETDRNKWSDRNVAVRPLRKGVEFKFQVYVNNISREELEKLVWTLELGGKENTAFKLGMGKPLGLGSVKIEVTDIKQRKVELADSLQYDFKPVTKPDFSVVEKKLGASPEVIEELIKIHTLDAVRNYSVEYPNNTDSEESFKWFMANKQITGTGTSPVIEQELPKVSNPALYKYEQIRANNRNNRNHRR